MKKRWVIFMLIFSVIPGIPAAANEPSANHAVEIVLSHPDSRDDAESGIIVFSLINKGQAPIHVLQALTPFDTKTDRVINNLFVVTDASGKQVEYTGFFASGADDADTLIKINPGETISKRVNLASSYDFGTGGPFKVMFTRDLLDEPEIDEDEVQGATSSHAYRPDVSNTLDIWINPALIKKPKSALWQHATSELSCKAAELATLDAALSKAKTLTANAIQYHANLRFAEGTGLKTTYKLKEDFRRNNWLGAYDDNWLPLSDSGWFNTENFYPIHVINTIAIRLGAAYPPKTLTFDCSCPPEWEEKGRVVAVAMKDQKIGICPLFFELADAGFNSKAGELIHEVTHFTDDLAPGMMDKRYGTGRAARLARKDKSAAMRNPDNYKYFIESGDL